jgi:hypothetical protein
MVESPSRTALATSLMRSLHSRSDPCPVLDDPRGDRLVPESERERMSQRILARMDSAAAPRALWAPDFILDEFLLTNAAFPGVVIRSRYAEDALGAAAIRGLGQYVLIGAGFDSFALRRPAFSDDLEIFEIDHPTTQTTKIRRIREMRHLASAVCALHRCRPRKGGSRYGFGSLFVPEGPGSILLLARRYGVPDAGSQSNNPACRGDLRCPGKRTCLHLCRSNRVRPGQISVAPQRNCPGGGGDRQTLCVRV